MAKSDKLSEIKGFVRLAEDDLKSARKLIRLFDRMPENAAFHCQQSVEKFLKAYLVYNDKIFPKTHDLDLLCGICIEINETFNVWEDICEILTQYAVEIRYDTIKGIGVTVKEIANYIKEIKNLKKYILSQMDFTAD
jgi:HEPN domain-containing protein